MIKQLNGEADEHGVPCADRGRICERLDSAAGQGNHLCGDQQENEGSERGSMKGYLSYTEDELVSQDFVRVIRSSIFDQKAGSC